MPTYQYACTACQQQLEVVQSFSDAALTECPACSGRLRKVYGAVGVVFKGSGFYKTDSRTPAKTGADGGSGTSSGASGDGASSGAAGGGGGKDAGAGSSASGNGSLGSGAGSSSSGSGTGSSSSSTRTAAAKSA